MQTSRQFHSHEKVVEDTYMLRSNHSVVAVNAKDVEVVAGILEAAVAMTEEVSDEEQIALSFSSWELRSFVCYMRQLDAAYRDQAKFIARSIPAEPTHEFKTTEEAAEISAERYDSLTGAGSREPP